MPDGEYENDFLKTFGKPPEQTQLSPEDEMERSRFWLNELSPTFLTADPPGAQGEPRFEVHFDVDENKRLLVTARDLKSGKVTLQGYPMVKLT